MSGNEARAFIVERAKLLLPDYTILGCSHDNPLFTLHLRHPRGHAELWLPITRDSVEQCSTGNYGELHAAFSLAGRLLELGR